MSRRFIYVFYLHTNYYCLILLNQMLMIYFVLTFIWCVNFYRILWRRKYNISVNKNRINTSGMPTYTKLSVGYEYFVVVL